MLADILSGIVMQAVFLARVKFRSVACFERGGFWGF